MQICQEQVLDNWTLFKLINNQQMEVHILNYGGIITKIIVPNKNGELENVVIGYKNEKDYKTNPNYFGALIGRVAGRIQDAKFELDGIAYELEQNEGNNHLHGGNIGFSHKIWKAEPFEEKEFIGVRLSHITPDGEGGYPGEIEVVVTYKLNNNNQFIIEYEAVSTKKTVLTLTNHTYFNLSGNLKNTIHDHEVTMNSSYFIELDQDLIPTGNKLSVENSSFDFRSGRRLAEGIVSMHPQNKVANNGYDHYFIFDENNTNYIIVREPYSGRKLTVKTNQPGLVMYTANKLHEGINLAERLSERYLGLCLETQGSPASLKHDGFPKIILEKDKLYQKKTMYIFEVE